MKSHMISLIVVLAAISPFCWACQGPSGPPGAAYFEFSDVDPEKRFVIKLVDPKKIDHARRILKGEEKSRVHISGIIVKEKAQYNSRWSYHLDPNSIDFFEVAVEVCDSSMQYVEDHLSEVGGSFLPENRWCPWSSKVVREL